MRRGGFGDLADETNARAKKSLALYLNPPPEPLPPLRVSNGARHHNTVLLRRCPHCAEFLPEGSRAQRRCRACGTSLLPDGG